MSKIVPLFLCLFFSFSLACVAGEEPIRVAVFQGEGVGASANALIKSMSGDENQGILVSRISAEKIQTGGLRALDVLVHSGGSGSKQGKALGEKGREAVRDFVRDGGGFLGVCAGAYLATNDYDWSLCLIDAKVTDRRHWARGKGDVELAFSPGGKRFFKPGAEPFSIYYAQGPLLSRREWDDPKVPNYESLAIYASEIAENGAPRGVMARTSAVVRAKYEEGRVFVYSPHPELTEGLRHWIPKAVRWAAGVE